MYNNCWCLLALSSDLSYISLAVISCFQKLDLLLSGFQFLTTSRTGDIHFVVIIFCIIFDIVSSLYVIFLDDRRNFCSGGAALASRVYLCTTNCCIYSVAKKFK